MKTVPVGITGLGGYAKSHLETLRALQSVGACRITAACDPFASRHPAVVAALQAEGAQLYADLDAMLERDDIAAVTIATPINLHATQTIAALRAGKSVYLEKPPCATLEELDSMLAAEADAKAKYPAGETGTTPQARVGFQMQSSAALRYAHQGLAAGRWGKLETISASVRWRREDDYYSRSAWAATWRQNGSPVFDGPATNALSHVVFAALFLGNEGGNRAASPVRVRGSLMRARPIESYDSILVEAELPRGVMLRLAFTHASEFHDPAALTLHCESATVRVDWHNNVTIRPRDSRVGEEVLYFGQSTAQSAMHDFINGLSTGAAGLLPTLEETRGYVQLTCGALQSSAARNAGGAGDFAQVRELGEGGRRVFLAEGLEEQMQAFAENPDNVPPLFQIEDKPWIQAGDIKPTLAV